MTNRAHRPEPLSRAKDQGEAMKAAQAAFEEAVRLDFEDGFPVPIELSCNGVVLRRVTRAELDERFPARRVGL